MDETNKRNKGITLIALIVTIIILLILAGVTIATLTGENGILSKAGKASEETKIATAEEKIKLAIGEYEVNQRLETLYSCLEKIEGLESIEPNDPNSIPPCHVIVDGYEFEITGERKVNYIKKANGISPEIEKFEKLNVAENKVTLKIKANTKDTQGLEKLIIKNGDAIIDQKDITGNQIDENIDVVANGSYTITIVGKNGRRATSEIIEVNEINTINGKITAGTVIDGKVALVTVGETGATNISKVEVYSKGNAISSKTFTDKKIEYETEAKDLVFYEDTTCYAILTDSNGKTFKTNEVTVKNTDTIANETDLRSFASVVNSGESFENAKEIKQINDITLAQTHTAIGTGAKPFKGTYNGKKIDGIQINNSEKDQGLFGFAENATIKNVILGNESIQGNYNIGGICGNANNSIISNCTNENTTVVAKSYITKTYTWENEETYKFSNVGGIIGYGDNCNIDLCNNKEVVNANYSAVGGIIGFDGGNRERKISNCNNEANLTINFKDDETYGVGGIAGECYKQGIIENCNNTRDITNGNQGCGNVGGIAGDSIGIIQNCNNKGSIEAKALVGGIAGANSSKIDNCTNEGTIKATGSTIMSAQINGKMEGWYSSSVGGIVGYNVGNIVFCKNKGNIQTQGDEAGGIAGYSLNNSSIRKSINYQNIENSQVQDIGGIVGYTNKCTLEECFNIGNITTKHFAGGIAGHTTYTTIKNCYNTGTITVTNERAGGIVGCVSPYELAHGYEYMYNCYNIGKVIGTSYKDTIARQANYLTWDYLYATKALYDVVGPGDWQNSIDGNDEMISGTDEQIKSKMLTNLLKGNGAGKWTRDTTNKKNNGYPYLIDNPV